MPNERKKKEGKKKRIITKLFFSAFVRRSCAYEQQSRSAHTMTYYCYFFQNEQCRRKKTERVTLNTDTQFDL